MDWGEDVFHHGEGGAQHVVREAGDKTTVECDPGKNCLEELEKRLDEQQKEIDGKQDKKDFFDRLGPDVAEGAAIGGVGGAIGGVIFGGIAGGPAGSLDGAIQGGVRGAVGGAMGGFGKDVVEWLES